MYKLKKQKIKSLPAPEPYQDQGDGAEIDEFVDDGTDVSEIDYPPEAQSEVDYCTDDDTVSEACSEQSEAPVPQYKALESNLEEETDFAEINF